MFIRAKHYNNAIQKVKILVGKELGLEKEEDASVTFREPSEKEVLLLKVAKDEAERIDAFEDLFKASIIEHDFYETEGQKMDDEAVIELLFEKMDTTEKVIGDYTKAVFSSRMTEAEEK